MEVSRLSRHYVTLPGWLYRAIRNEAIPVSIFPEISAVGLCWYEVYCDSHLTAERGDRFCSRCAQRAFALYPMGIAVKYIDTKILDRESIMCRAIARYDHYCAHCRATLYAIKNNIDNSYRNLDDCIRGVRFAQPAEMARMQADDYDSGIEV